MLLLLLLLLLLIIIALILALIAAMVITARALLDLQQRDITPFLAPALVSSGRENQLCWLLETSVRKIGLLCPMKEASCQSMCSASTINAVHFAPVFRTCAHFHKHEVLFVQYVLLSIKQRICLCLHKLQEYILRWLKPSTASLALGTFADLTRGKAELLAENALLRQQLIILCRQVKRPVYRKRDRLLLVVLASMVRTWKQALFLVQPETLLRWHRELFRVYWTHKCRVHERKPRLSSEAISLIKEMAANNRLWGAERIRGELLKLDIRVSKRTIQRYIRQGRPKRIRGQTWKTFLRNHVAQQLREATPYGQTPTYLIRDNDKKFGPGFARVATISGIKVLRTPYRTPQANAICERFLGSVRRECLDHFFIFHEKQLSRLLKAYTRYFNQARPHQGLGQRIPDPPVLSAPSANQLSKVCAVPVLGGLHHDYQKAA